MMAQLNSDNWFSAHKCPIIVPPQSAEMVGESIVYFMCSGHQNKHNMSQETKTCTVKWFEVMT